MDVDSDTTIHFLGPSSLSSKPSLLLIHGFGPHGVWQWRQQIFQANTLATLMENLGVNNFSVVGTSYGGFVAYRLAEMWPGRVDKVVIASSGVNMRPRDKCRLDETGES